MKRYVTEEPCLEKDEVTRKWQGTGPPVGAVSQRNREEGALYVYDRRILLPVELRTAGTALGYWRVIPASLRNSVEAHLMTLGWEIAPERGRLSARGTALNSGKAYQKAVSELLRLAIEERAHAVEIIRVHAQHSFLLQRCQIAARIVSIRKIWERAAREKDEMVRKLA